MKITIRILNRAILFDLVCEPSDTVDKLKTMISTNTQISVENQQLLYAGTLLEENTLQDNNVIHGSMIHLLEITETRYIQRQVAGMLTPHNPLLGLPVSNEPVSFSVPQSDLLPQFTPVIRHITFVHTGAFPEFDFQGHDDSRDSMRSTQVSFQSFDQLPHITIFRHIAGSPILEFNNHHTVASADHSSSRPSQHEEALSENSQTVVSSSVQAPSQSAPSLSLPSHSTQPAYQQTTLDSSRTENRQRPNCSQTLSGLPSRPKARRRRT